MTFRQILLLLLLAFLWGGSFVFIRVAALEFTAVSLAFFRVFIAALVLLLVLLVKSKLRALFTHSWHLIILGIFSSAIPFVCFSFALQSLSSGYGSILNATTPLSSSVIAFFWLSERLSKTQIAGLLIGFSGVIVLVWNKLLLTQLEAGWPVLAVLFATLMYAIASSYGKRFLSGVEPTVVAAGSQIGAVLVLLPSLVFNLPEQVPSTDAWLAIIALGALCTALAYIIFFYLLDNAGPTNTVSVTFLIPVFATTLGVIFLNEQIDITMIMGGFIILFGTALVAGIKLPTLTKKRISTS